MEFVQFHPTVLFAPSAPQFLLSEAMRGEGGILRNIKGEPFMKNYHPDAELAPRDVVSRSIVSEMVKTGSRHVSLDLTHLNAKFIKKRFPRIYSTCLQYDVDITKELIPVSPAAHYMMGGIKTDIYGATNIKGLYAAGEVACTGVHGANRLASNSLLEGLVLGARAGSMALNTPISRVQIESSSMGMPYSMRPPMSHSFIPAHEEIRHTLRKLMWEKVGIIRCQASLDEAKENLEKWSFILDKKVVTRRELELKNMLTVTGLIVDAASLRKGSVGAHYRTDFPQRGEEWQKHLTFKKKEDREFHYELVD